MGAKSDKSERVCVEIYHGLPDEKGAIHVLQQRGQGDEVSCCQRSQSVDARIFMFI